MNKFKLASSLTTVALVVSAFAPAAFADTNVNVDHNGAGSETGVAVNDNTNTNVNQNSSTVVSNTVDVHQNTGKNDASYNVGGVNNINTGGTVANIQIQNTSGSNLTVLTPCNQCGGGNTNVNIAHNGWWSEQEVAINKNNNTNVNQNNNCTLLNTVHVGQNSGKNSTNFNVWSHNNINTGPAIANTAINNTCGDNGASK